MERKSENMVIEITMEKTQRISKEFEVTEEQLEALKLGINLFQDDLEKELESGDCEYDFAVNDENGIIIVDWK